MPWTQKRKPLRSETFDNIQSIFSNSINRRLMRMFMRYTHKFVVIIHVKTNVAVELDPSWTVPSFPTAHGGWIREGISIKHQQSRSVYRRYYFYCKLKIYSEYTTDMKSTITKKTIARKFCIYFWDTDTNCNVKIVKILMKLL